jgi:hypothetical protein
VGRPMKMTATEKPGRESNKMNEGETIASAAAAAADELIAIIEPFEKLSNALRRLGSTKIAGSDEQVQILNRQGVPALHKLARELRTYPKIKKLRSRIANCRPELQEMFEAVTAIEKVLRGN